MMQLIISAPDQVLRAQPPTNKSQSGGRLASGFLPALGLVDRHTDQHGKQRWQDAEEEHAAPADIGDEERCD